MTGGDVGAKLDIRALATEDFSHLLTTVESKGGKGTHVQLAPTSPPVITIYFDFNEKVIAYFCEFMARVAYSLLA